MKECKYCHWQYQQVIEIDKARREANNRGFCGPACAIAWDAEKKYILERERRQA